MKAELIRHYGPQVTQGLLTFLDDKGVLIGNAMTIELPDLNNEPGKSCIPSGEYDVCVVNPSDKIKYVHFWIQNVPDRAGIKIHIANYVSQLRGCVAVGKSHADINKDGIIDVTQSTAALQDLLAIAKEQGYDEKNMKSFKLTIK